MKNSFVRAAAAAALVAGLWAGTCTTAVTAHAATRVTATAGVNIRSGPGLDQPIIGGLAQGASIDATGPSSNGWTPVAYQGRTGYIFSAYLSGGGAFSSGGATRQTTAYLNVRSGPGTGYGVIRVLPPQTPVSLTGEEQNGFAKLTGGGWVSTSWLSSPVTPAPTPAPAPQGKDMVTTAPLNFRSGPSLNEGVIRVLAEGTTVRTTGREANGFAEVVVGSSTGWCSQQYLAAPGSASTPAPAPTPSQPAPGPTTPTATGTKYATDALNVRPTPGFDNNPVGFVPRGTALQVTGVVQGEWTQIVYSGTIRWVYTQYLSSSPINTTGPSVGLDGLKSTTAAAVAAIRANFPQITTVYGVRPDGPGQDHTEGRAADFMVPSYRTNHELGQAIADYLQAHAAEFDVRYIIWEQRIWLADAPWQGWTWMADRGSDTQNHYDHIHLSVH